MTIRVEIDAAKRIVVLIVSEKATPADLQNSLIKIYESGSELDRLWDFRKADFKQDFSMDYMDDSFNILRKMEHRQGGKVAFVAPSDNQYGYGLLRQYENYSQVKKLPIEIRVFLEMEEARAWLESDKSD